VTCSTDMDDEPVCNELPLRKVASSIVVTSLIALIVISSVDDAFASTSAEIVLPTRARDESTEQSRTLALAAARFSFVYPVNWKAVSNETSSTGGHAKAENMAGAGKGNCNVRANIDPRLGAISSADYMARTDGPSMLEEMRSMHKGAIGRRHGTMTVAGTPARYAEIDAPLQGQITATMMTIQFVTAGTLFTISCTAEKGFYQSALPDFGLVVQSFRVLKR
jgi:hypothetical protein